MLPTMTSDTSIRLDDDDDASASTLDHFITRDDDLSHDITSLQLSHGVASPSLAGTGGVPRQSTRSTAGTLLSNIRSNTTKPITNNSDANLSAFMSSLAAKPIKSVGFQASSISHNQGASDRPLSLDSKALDFSTPRQPQVPASIFTTANRDKLQRAYDPTKTYRLFIASDSQDVLDQHCFCIMRGGYGFCIDTDCRQHRHGERLDIKPGMAFIKRSTKQAFLEPSVSTASLSFDLLNTWMEESLTLTQWNHKFDLLSSSLRENKNVEITAPMLETAQAAKLQALTHQSSRKRKAEPVDLKVIQDELNFLGQHNLGTDPVNGDTVIDIVSRMESSFRNLRNLVNGIYGNGQAANLDTNVSLLSNEEKITTLSRMIGSKPDRLSSVVDAPTIWSSIALIGSEFNLFNKQMDDKIQHNIKKLKPSVDMNMIHLIEQELSKLDGRINVVTDSLVEVGSNLTSQLQSLSHHVSVSSTPARGNLSTHTRHEKLDQEWKSTVEAELKLLKGLSDDDTVRFGGVGVKSLTEAQAWLALHDPSDDFGHIVDAHVIFEYLYRDMDKADSNFLKSQLLLNKAGLSNEFEGSTITSYERSIPRLFLSSGRVRIIRNDESYFDTMPTYLDWRTNETGYRDHLMLGLKLFKDSHLQFLRNELPSSSLLYQVAYESVIFSISWIEDFFRFIEETYRDYYCTLRDDAEAWSITTRLARSLLHNISVPRTGVKAALKSKDKRQMKAITFFGMLRSLDRMTKISQSNFKNSQIISNELVKVLSKTSHVSAIRSLETSVSDLLAENQKLQDKIKLLESKQVELGKLANSCNTKSTNASNDIAALTKRVVKVENKK